MTEPQIDEDVMQAARAIMLKLPRSQALFAGEKIEATRLIALALMTERAKSTDALAKAYTDGQAAMHDLAADHMDKKVAERARSTYPAGVRAGLEMAEANLISFRDAHCQGTLQNVLLNVAARRIRALIPPADPRKPLKIEMNEEWCVKMAALEGDQEIGAGFETIPAADPQSDAIRAVVGALKSAAELIPKLTTEFPDAIQGFNGVWASYRDEFAQALTLAMEARLAGTEDRG